MLLALAILAGCWRPDPYTPPPPPEPEADAEEPGNAAEEPGNGEGEEPSAEEAPAAEAAAEDEPDEEEVEAPAFTAYPARTVQAPVTIVDDWGKPLAVLGTAGWEVEVRGEDTIRTRVWCGTCSPPVEGWIQAHLVERR